MTYDNRIRFTPALIDFVNDVGLTGQDHDNYPAPGSQSRYDHIRMYLIGLLSQQSSYIEPTQKRDGTPWFDLNELCLKIYFNGNWIPYSDAIKIGDIKLSDWCNNVDLALQGIFPDLVFFGACTLTGVDQIPIPVPLQSQITINTRVFITITSSLGSNLIDPREVQLLGAPLPTTIFLPNHQLELNDQFTVVMRRLPNETFYTATVNVP
jgi:hypothetical protein